MSLHAPAMGEEGRGSSSNLSMTGSERSGSRDRDRTDMSTFRAIALLAVDDSEPSEYAFNCEYTFTLYSTCTKLESTYYLSVCKSLGQILDFGCRAGPHGGVVALKAWECR
jgi:hypothetical protein